MDRRRLNHNGILGALSGVLLAGALPHPSPAAVLVCGAVGALFFSAGSRAVQARGREPSLPRRTATVERFAPLGLLLFLVPAFRLAVAPGADAAMYAALARGIAESSPALSPAWGPADPLAYPRGFPCLIAALAPLAGIGKASLLAAAIGFAVFYAGLRGLLARAGASHPGALALLGLLLCKTPQSFFGWGGAPSIFATGLVWIAAAGWCGGVGGARTGALRTGWLGAAAVATHPVGALAGLAGVAAAVALGVRIGPGTPGRDRSRPLAVSILPVTAMALSFAWFALAGPRVSPEEAHWIRGYQQSVERMLASGPSGFAGALATAPVRLVAKLPGILGDPYVGVLVAAALLELVHRAGRRRVAALLGTIAGLALLLEIGPRLPVLGTLLFPARFSPILLLVTLPMIGRAWRSVSARHRRSAAALALAVFALAAVRHAGWYQECAALATRDDVEVLECLRESLATSDPESGDPVLDGDYESAAQWAPALVGIPVTHPHVHISLRDEVEPWLDQLRPTYAWVSDAPAGAVDRDPSLLLCRAGLSAVRAR